MKLRRLLHILGHNLFAARPRYTVLELYLLFNCFAERPCPVRVTQFLYTHKCLLYSELAAYHEPARSRTDKLLMERPEASARQREVNPHVREHADDGAHGSECG